MSITTAQIRGARGILNWSQADLSGRTGISATSIGSIENGQSTPRANTLHTIQKAFEDAGIEFIGREGVRLRTGNVRTFTGQKGFVEFFDHVYETLKNDPSEVYVSNVEEKKFVYWYGDMGQPHIDRMAKLKSVHYKVLLKEGDTDFVCSAYAAYRWVPRELFSSVPFYVFGKKLAIILMEDEPHVVLLDYPAIAEAYRIQFRTMWENAIVIPDMAEPGKRKHA